MPSNQTQTAITPNPTSLPANLQQRAPDGIFKVAVLGAESTGKTTLCQDLAAHFKSTWVCEYMRPYLQKKWDNEHKKCEWHDLMPIAVGQVAEENRQAHLANRYVFCDTTLFELMVYAKLYYDDCPPAITQAALTHHYDLILLTEVDIPWEADDLRDCPNGRARIRQIFADTLSKHGKAFKRIGGTRQQRVKQVATWLTDC